MILPKNDRLVPIKTLFDMHRLCIYPSDVVLITGRSERYAREVMKDIRLLHRKNRRQLVTIAEFCDYSGLPYEEVNAMINKGSP